MSAHVRVCLPSCNRPCVEPSLLHRVGSSRSSYLLGSSWQWSLGGWQPWRPLFHHQPCPSESPHGLRGRGSGFGYSFGKQHQTQRSCGGWSGRAGIHGLHYEDLQDVLPHSTLREIDLSAVAIDNATVKWVAGALRDTSLKTLGLRRCSLSAEAVISLAEALHNNLSLTNLNLSGNDFCDVGAAHLAGVLKANATLQRLLLANCGIGPQGARDIAEALVANVTLNTLDLGFNNIGDGVAFVETLKVNRSLLTLSVDASDTTLGVLEVLLRRNRSRLVSGAPSSKKLPRIQYS